MRPYLAVIRDSFREALATRVLWIVLILITLFLALVAPLGYHATVAISLQWDDLRDPPKFVEHLVKQQDSPETPAGYLWSRLPEGFQKELRELKPDSGRGARMRAAGRLRHEINQQLHSRDFYTAEVFKSSGLGSEAAELREQGLETLSDEQHARFTRIAFDAAFRDFVESAGRDAIQLDYLWYPVGDEFPASEEQVQQIVRIVISVVVSLVVGYLGVFVALLVTASIVPQMLDAGAIDLLLSKPVSRPLLFLSKFAGGCMFILVNSVYLIVGLWLVIGLRFNLWSSGLLWTIPVFVFIFAIYYSVSALAAVIWRNAVVSIVVSILFFGVCFSAGVAKSFLDQWILETRRTAVIVPAGESLIVTNRQGNGFEWNADDKTWAETFRSQRRGPGRDGGRYPMIGPYFDSGNDRLVAIRSTSSGWIRGTPKLNVAPREGNWKPIESISVPNGTKMLAIDKDGDTLVAGTGGLFRFQGDPEAGDGGIEVFGMKIPGLGKPAEFVRIDDATLEWKTPFSVTHDAASGELVVRSGEKLALLTSNDEGRYEVATILDWPDTDQSIIGRAGSRVALASEDGSVEILDAETLQAVGKYTPYGRNQPRSIHASPDGRWLAVLFHHRRVWLYDTQADQPGSRSPAGQGDISALTFGPDNSLYASSGFRRVIKYDNVESMTEVARFAQESDLVENLYQWVIDPVYTVFPKPGEMGDVVTWLMTEQETFATDEEDLAADRVALDIWEPIWSNLAFLSVTLTVTCVFVTRKDF